MNLNSSFRAAVQAVTKQQTLSHQQVVTRMYRDALRTLTSWAMDRDIFNEEATVIRSRFDAHKDEPVDSGLTARLVREGKEELAHYKHPDPYVTPFMPGGSKFMRNPALPFDHVFPDGIPPEVSHVAPQDVHYVQVPMSATPEGMESVIVDFYKKNAE